MLTPHELQALLGARDAVARRLTHERAALAADVVDSLRASAPQLRVPPLIARTVVERILKAVETGDAQLVVHWCRMVRSTFDAHTVTAVVGTACDIVMRAANDSELDAGDVYVFLEIVKAVVNEALMTPGTADRAVTAIESVLGLLRTRDGATCDHSHATGAWCRRISETLSLSPELTERIVRGGMLHDIGKISTPVPILVKTGSLTNEEWRTMRLHPGQGADLLEQIPSLTEYAPIVRAHHERMDGAGYPDGLSGHAFPFEARVVAVADAFHSMISDRPYRRAMTFGAAMDVLRKGRGTQWDGDVVDALVLCAGRVRSSSRDADLAKLQPADAPIAENTGSLAG